MDVYDRIEQEMKKAGQKPIDLHRATGLSTALLTQWKQRQQIPSRDKLVLVAKHFNVSVDYLLTGQNTQQKSSLPEPSDNPIIWEIVDLLSKLSGDKLNEALSYIKYLEEKK